MPVIWPSLVTPCVCGFVRTPFGRPGRVLRDVHPALLAALCLDTVLERTGLPPSDVAGVLIGNSISGGLGQHPAQQVVTKSMSLRDLGSKGGVPAISFNTVCTSGLEALCDASRRLACGEGELFAVGGMESMSLALNTQHDGLTCAITKESMGQLAERYYRKRGYTREQLDEVVINSCEAALRYQDRDSIIPLYLSSDGEITTKDYGQPLLSKDEQLERYSRPRLSTLRPCFTEDGILTAASSSTPADGAAMLLVASEAYLQRLGYAGSYARIVAYAYTVLSPDQYLRAPAVIVQEFRAAGLVPKRVTVTEAFAGVVLDVAESLELDWHTCVNPFGDALACGHPLSVSSCRIVGDLLACLEVGELGFAVACNGGGGGYGVALERIH
ncbi:Acetyl-CoA acetyltransferase [Giardia muris]|uniref:Acetyl-CoA acetyltransferase n=1 Tax=Giardia muris TaxID=5742 RepID=A0A4Z1T9F3_GIAMU|nr:Acetyl-CoA acetyltransferase [Giardia muris]|eukprot:TNJ29159.1 Acetyl-CoA acetyltransferase [Giardia muris]